MTHQRSPNFSLPFVSRWLFVSRLEVFVGCKNYTKTLRSKLQNWQSDNHCDTSMQQWLVDRLTGWPWQFEGIASEHQKAALHLGSSLIAEIQLMHQINVSGCVTAVTVFWTSDFCQGDLAPVVAEELKQVGKMRVKKKRLNETHKHKTLSILNSQVD